MLLFSRPKLADFYFLFQTKLFENFTLHSSTYPYCLYMRVPSPHPPPPPFLAMLYRQYSLDTSTYMYLKGLLYVFLFFFFGGGGGRRVGEGGKKCIYETCETCSANCSFTCVSQPSLLICFHCESKISMDNLSRTRLLYCTVVYFFRILAFRLKKNQYESTFD